MSKKNAKETLGFQTEVSQLLHLMIHSLYSNKEIFLRELISNASDAVDKLRFEALAVDGLLAGDTELKIRIDVDEKANTITIADNGIGMSRQEVIDNLGTIAKSGTSQFLEQMSGDQKKDSALIGQFGVGFYSGFIVAKQMDVFTRRAGLAADEAAHWSSSGEGDFSIESYNLEQRGTKVVLHLRDDCTEFADEHRVRGIITKYADHISIPVIMKTAPLPELDEEGKPKADSNPEPVDEVVNKATALWARSKSELTDEEYQEFYHHVSHDFNDALVWAHNKVEGKLEYTSLLYVPTKAPFDMYNREAPRGLKLYVQRVFIMDDAEQFLPLYLRFMKGVIDTNDLDLNVSREILQDNEAVSSIRSALIKRVLDMLSKLANKEKDKYQEFWKEFGDVLKEAVAEDYANRDKVVKLYRFASTHNKDDAQTVSLEDYIGRMQEGQDKIYYTTAENYASAISSPHLEVFRKKGIEVLLLNGRIDEWMMSHLFEFEGKSFQHIAKGELDQVLSEEESKDQEERAKEAESLTKRIQEVLSEQVDAVRVTHRLTESPACLVLNAHEMGAQMRQIMESAGQPLPETKPSFEINPDHELIKQLDCEADEDRFKDLALVLFDQACLADGHPLKDANSYVKRVNRLLLGLA